MSLVAWPEVLARRIVEQQRCIAEGERLLDRFSSQGRPLANVIAANYELLRGLIVLQRALSETRQPH
jgi:hypothetical protein